MNICPSVIAYSIFLIALMLYNIYMGQWPSFLRSALYLIVGALLLWILCAANMEVVGWSLLGIPVVFYIFLFAILIFDQGFRMNSTYKTVCKKPTDSDCEEEEEEPTCEAEDESDTCKK
jgi:predicted membrane protein